MRPYWLFLLLVVGAIGCSRSKAPYNPVSEMGLLETTNGRELADRTVTLANSLLGPDAKITLRTSWTAENPGARQVATVYLVNTAGAPALYMVVVPSDCGCIFIQPQRYAAWVTQYSTTLSSMLPISSENVLVFMLLHEIGHIVNRDRGEFVEPAGENSSGLSTKEREERADSFAVLHLMAAAKRTKDTDAWLNAMHVEMDLANLSWNIQALRQNEYFGSTVLGTPAAFADAGYSHPNFELRILTVNDQISHTAISHQLLESFQATRNRKGDPVLFKK
jgi:hypothetical protein